jgi:hypothetical protein
MALSISIERGVFHRQKSIQQTLRQPFNVLRIILLDTLV